MSECVRNTIVDKLKGKATSYIISKDKTEIFVPSKKFGEASSFRIAESMVNKANKIFNFKLFGSSVSLNTSYSDGTAVNIHPTQKLIDSYEVKEKVKSIKDIIDDFSKLENEANQTVNEEGDVIIKNEQSKLKNNFTLFEKDNKYSTNKTNDNNLKEGLQWLKEIMPDISPILVDGLINNIANGSYDIVNDLITLSKDFANKQVVKEEAFHRIFNLLPKEEQEKLFQEGSKKYGIERGESKATIKYSLADQNKVDFGLKSVEILQSPKADEIFRKGDKNNWDIDKILQELQIPKQQQDLIKGFNTRNREQILTSLLANYSYTIEINTAKNNLNQDDGTLKVITYNNIEYINVGDWWMVDGEFENASDELQVILNKKYDSENGIFFDTQYYSNLTVPGGTNYIENEIATPAITPFIKGHAQFATDNSIGWFRSDEQVLGSILESTKIRTSWHPDLETDEEGYGIKDGFKTVDGEVTKTRRILEVQSDLFQKSRNAKNLSYYNEELQSERFFQEDGKYYWYDSMGVQFGEENKKEITKEIYDKGVNGELTIDNKKEGFLQLLLKDNAWVGFFIKSVIQDSAKKGYEKVLFPSGNTASKVEGHTTLEEFKKEKEDRIKELENKKPQILEDNGQFKVLEPNQGATMDIVSTKKEAEEIWEKRYRQKYVNEINQLKQELERVETEGFGALKPIYNFYENTVTNILNKTYGKENVKVITDEYGNTWNEITITPEMSKTIRLNTPNGKVEYKGDLAIEEKMAEEAFNSKDEKTSTTLIGKLIQSIRNLLRNLFKEKDDISRLIRDLNQGRIKNDLYNKETNSNIINKQDYPPITLQC